MSRELQLPSLKALRAERCRRDFREFVKEFWKIADPASELHWNWHLDVICNTLQAISERKLKGAVFCVPPGTAKSLSVSVLWPSWEWLPGNYPEEQSIYVSGAQSLTVRDSLRMRNVVDSAEYKEFKELLAAANQEKSWEIRKSQKAKDNFQNTLGGNRQSITAGQKFTGLRGSKIVIDDPVDVKEVLKGSSERISERMAEIREWYDKKLSSRRNQMATDPIVLIMQRVHDEDLAGVLINRQLEGFKYIILPAEYDPELACDEDPRTKPGELLDPYILPASVLASQREHMAEQYAAQYGQRPVLAEGGMFKVAWFKNTYPWMGGQYLNNPSLPKFHRRALFADTANKAKEINDPSVLGLWGQDMNQDVWKLGQWRERLGFYDLLDLTARVIREHKPDVFVCEENASGIQLIDMIKRTFPGLTVIGIPRSPLDTKDMRASNTTHWWASGRVHIPDDSCPWALGFRDEHLRFPQGRNDDQVDETSMALQWFHDHRTLFRHRIMVGGQVLEGTGQEDNPFVVYDREGRLVVTESQQIDPEDKSSYRQAAADQGKLLWQGVGTAMGIDRWRNGGW